MPSEDVKIDPMPTATNFPLPNVTPKRGYVAPEDWLTQLTPSGEDRIAQLADVVPAPLTMAEPLPTATNCPFP
jgi:hypothetical protein